MIVSQIGMAAQAFVRHNNQMGDDTRQPGLERCLAIETRLSRRSENSRRSSRTKGHQRIPALRQTAPAASQPLLSAAGWLQRALAPLLAPRFRRTSPRARKLRPTWAALPTQADVRENGRPRFQPGSPYDVGLLRHSIVVSILRHAQGFHRFHCSLHFKRVQDARYALSRERRKSSVSTGHKGGRARRSAAVYLRRL